MQSWQMTRHRLFREMYSRGSQAKNETQAEEVKRHGLRMQANHQEVQEIQIELHVIKELVVKSILPT